MSLLDAFRRTVWTLAQFPPSRLAPRLVRQRQERRLRRLLRFAAKRSAFYRERFRGLDRNRCSLDALPTTTKAEIMANFDLVVTEPTIRRAAVEEFIDDPTNVGKLFHGRSVCHTSGSQGQPMLVVQDWRSLDLLFAFQMTRGNVGFIRRGMGEAIGRLFRPARLAVIISRQGFFPSAWVWKHLPASMRRFLDLLYLMGNDPDLVSKLNAFRPTALTATPTTLDFLATRSDPPRLPDLEQVVSNSEILSPAARGRIAAAFGAPILDNYACGECLFLSNGCPTHPGVHINADWALIEVVDDDHRAVPPGTLGAKVLITNLANYTQPLIRYEVGDRIALAADSCACGSRLPRIDQIFGRGADVFTLTIDGAHRILSAYPLQHAFEYFRDIREWQAVHLGGNRILIRFEPLPEARLDVDRIRSRLHERLAYAGFVDQLDIRFETVAHLDVDSRTGKFRRMVRIPGRETEMMEQAARWR